MLRWVDGFEHYGAKARMLEGVGGGAAWSEADTRWTLSTVNPATGTYHMRLTEDTGGASEFIRRALGQSKQVSGFGYRFNVSVLPAIESSDPADEYLQMIGFNDVSNIQQFRINMGTEGSVHLLSTSGLNYRSDPVIAAGGYHHFEAKAKIDNSTGYVEVRVNEVTVLNVTGIDTQSSANAETSQFSICQAGDVLDSGPGFGLYDVDDCFAWDNDASDAENTVVDFIGDKGCYYLKPNADTATSEFTVNASATAYGALDEVPPNGTDYLDDTTGTARTIVGVESLPGNVSEVIAMASVIYARKEESGTVELRGGIVVSTDESYGPTDSPSTAYAYIRPAVKTIDPNTGVAWTNNAEPELLIERTA